VLPVDSGVVFAAGRLRKRIGGGDAHRLLLPLVSAMDGRRTLAEVAAAAGVPEPQAAEAVALLRRQGLVVHGPPPATAVADEVRDFLELTAGASARLPSAADVLAALGSSAVAVRADPDIADAIGADLTATGVRCVADPAALGAARDSLLVLQDRPGGDADPAGLVERCLRDGVAVLRFGLDGDALEWGPLLHPAVPLCWTCFADGHRAHRAGAPPGPPPAAAHRALAAGVLVAEVLAYVADMSDVRTYRTMHRLDLADLSRRRFVVTPEPACRRCSPGIALADPAALADAYEDAVALGAPMDERPASAAYRDALAALEDLRTPHPTLPRVPLPAVADVPGELTDAGVRAGAARPFEEAVAGLLSRTAGRRDGHRRWAASGGNLGSVEPYLVCREPLGGWPSGTLFKYDDTRHELIVMAAEPEPYGAWLAGGAADALVVLVTAVGRLERKYGPFSTRLAHLDAGCALAQLHAVAAGYGLRVTTADRWDDGLAARLELAGGDLVTAVVAIGKGDRGADPR